MNNPYFSVGAYVLALFLLSSWSMNESLCIFGQRAELHVLGYCAVKGCRCQAFQPQEEACQL